MQWWQENPAAQLFLSQIQLQTATWVGVISFCLHGSKITCIDQKWRRNKQIPAWGLVTHISTCMRLRVESFQDKGQIWKHLFETAIQLPDSWFSTLTFQKSWVPHLIWSDILFWLYSMEMTALSWFPAPSLLPLTVNFYLTSKWSGQP